MKQSLFKLSIAIWCFLLCGSVKAQFKENIQAIGGSYDDQVIKVIHDKDDNRYILGKIGMPGSIPSFNEYKEEVIDFGNLQEEVVNGFIAKYNKDNHCVWVRPSPRNIGNSYFDFTVDDAGFVYVTGGVHYGQFILEKIDQNGQLVWEKKYRSRELFNNFYGRSVAVDKLGNVYVVGTFDGTAMDNITFNFNATNGTPYTDFLAKFGPDGEALWVETSLGGNIHYTHVLVDSNGNILTVGGFKNAISVGEYTLENRTPADSYGPVYDKYIVNRGPDGQVIWAKSYPLRINGLPSFILDAEDNIYFTTPSYYGDSPAVVIDNVLIDRTKKQTLLKLDHLGTVQWAVNFQGSYSSLPLLYANQSLYIAGDFSGEFKFQDKAIKGNGAWVNDIFLVNLSLNGEALGVARYGGPATETKASLSFLPKQKDIVLAAT